VFETSVLPEVSTISHGHRGKAPPLDTSTGVILKFHLIIGFPHLSKEQNGMTMEKMMQLVGHLQGKAAQEYNLFIIIGEAAIHYSCSLTSVASTARPW